MINSKRAVGATPTLWICGPPGVGKSVVAWDIFMELLSTGIATAYVDIDQLGICYPAPEQDADRYAMKSTNLGRVIPNFCTAGARCVVVSGVADPEAGVRGELMPGAQLTVCRLRASAKVLTQRLVERGAHADLVEGVIQYAKAMDVTDFADICIDTSESSGSEVSRSVLSRLGEWPAQIAAPGSTHAQVPRPTSDHPASAGRIIWICGTTAVGKSTVGWQLFESRTHAGLTTGFVDLEQIGFYEPAPVGDPNNHQLKSRSLASIWQTYREYGAESLVVVGAVNTLKAIELYRNVLSAAPLVVCRLHAGLEHLTHRVLMRGEGIRPRIAGDHLIGKPTASLIRIAAQAAATAESLRTISVGDIAIDTDGLSVDEVVAALRSRIDGWPGLG